MIRRAKMSPSKPHPDVDALYEKVLNLPSHLTMAHELLDLVKYTRSLEEQLQAQQEHIHRAAACLDDALALLNPASRRDG